MAEVRRRHLSRSKLNNSEISLADVTPPATVMIRNLPVDVSRDVLELYFSNRRRSDGGHVTNVTLDHEHQHALVTFADYKGNQMMSTSDFTHSVIHSLYRRSSSDQTGTLNSWTSAGCAHLLSLHGH